MKFHEHWFPMNVSFEGRPVEDNAQSTQERGNWNSERGGSMMHFLDPEHLASQLARQTRQRLFSDDNPPRAFWLLALEARLRARFFRDIMSVRNRTNISLGVAQSRHALPGEKSRSTTSRSFRSRAGFRMRAVSNGA